MIALELAVGDVISVSGAEHVGPVLVAPFQSCRRLVVTYLCTPCGQRHAVKLFRRQVVRAVRAGAS